MNEVASLEPQWRPVVGLEGRFIVSDTGIVRSLPSRTGKGRERKPWFDPLGYSWIAYRLGEKTKSFSIHRAVAEAFVENPELLPVVNHIDSDTRNNRADNLEWVTVKGNTQHAIRQGRMDLTQNRGERHGMHKLTLIQVINIKHCKDTISGGKLARLYGVGSQTIYDIWNGRRWANALKQGVLKRGES